MRNTANLAAVGHSPPLPATLGKVEFRLPGCHETSGILRDFHNFGRSGREFLAHVRGRDGCIINYILVSGYLLVDLLVSVIFSELYSIDV